MWCYIFIQSHIIDNILIWPLSFVGSFMFISSLVLLYLDGFKLSDEKFIKYIQIFSFLYIPLYTRYCISNLPCTLISDIILYTKDNNDINLHGHVSLDKEAGKATGQGLNTVACKIGLSASLAGVATAVGRTKSKSCLPTLQK